jgi:hypothetical protein
VLGKLRNYVAAPLLALGIVGGGLVLDTDAAHAATASVRVKGKLKVRAGAANWTTQTRTLNNRARITVTCKVSGQYVRGTVRRSAQWDRLALGDYIPHAYVAGNPRLPACPPPPPPPAPAPAPAAVAPPVKESTVTAPAGPTGTMTTAQFITASVPGAQLSQRETQVPASVTIAQAILESGWGRSALSTFDKNFFGMKCFSQGSYAIGCRSHATNECTPLGVCFGTTASFRVYASAADSFRDHGALLAGAARYQPAFAHADNPDQFAVQIAAAGYATDPQYATKLSAIMAKYRLYQYDLR